MIKKVSDYIKDNKLINMGDSIVVGVSGGADSVCLLFVLYELSKVYAAKLVVVHVNHRIRGTEADMDEQYVIGLCKALNISYEGFNIDVREIAAKERLSEEEAGRNIRYQSFIKTCKQYECNKVAVAHNKNDNAETILFNLFRGSGIKGITGMEPINRINIGDNETTIIRPLLCVSRAEIEEYLRYKGIEYRTDATNLTDDYSRNKLRNQVLSYVTAHINSNAIEHINMAAAQLRDIDEFVDSTVMRYYKKHINEGKDSISFSVESILKEDVVIRRGVVIKIIESLAGSLKDIEAKHVAQVLSLIDKQVGKRTNLPYGITARRDYDEIILIRGEEYRFLLKGNSVAPLTLNIPGTTYIPHLNKFIESSITDYDENISFPKNTCTKWFDYDKIENAVELRNRKEGDYLLVTYQDGKGKNVKLGKKKLKDYFIDQKVPKDERGFKTLVADGSHIMWIIGDEERMSDGYEINEKTQKVLIMSLKDAKEN